MNRIYQIMGFGFLVFAFTRCTTDDVRNIAGTISPTDPEVLISTEVKPVDINIEGFDLLEKMQGHWVGKNRVIADDYDWFAFDYRANAPSQIHGIFEGGSAGNLLTSFFVTDFKNTRTIMARNGGLLNGIYRTSYFVLDSVRNDENGKYFRLVDAKGGTGVMFMELRFKQDSLYWNAYTSRLGIIVPPSRHMTFKGQKMNLDLAQTAASTVGFPQNIPTIDFSNGFVEENLYINPGDNEAKSATFLAQATDNSDVFSLAEESGDPYKIDQHLYLGYLTINIERNAAIEDETLLIQLSKKALTDETGFFVTDQDAFNSVLLFPSLSQGENQFFVTYLHPGDYFVNVTADINGDGIISQGDITHPRQIITIQPEQQAEITINNITVQN